MVVWLLSELQIFSAIMSKPDKYIGAHFTIDLKDKRIVDGVLTAVDPFGNILLSNAFESNEKSRRDIGLVSVPRSTIDKISINEKTYKQLKEI